MGRPDRGREAACRQLATTSGKRAVSAHTGFELPDEAAYRLRQNVERDLAGPGRTAATAAMASSKISAYRQRAAASAALIARRVWAVFFFT